MTDNRTTELREKLTERGVEYETNDHMGVFETSWNGFTAMQLTPSAKLIMVVTPEQAIAATLGSGTCEVEVRESAWGGYTRHCGNCGADLDCDTRNKQNYCPNCGVRLVSA